MADTPVTRAFRLIEACTDPKQLRQIAINARAKGEEAVARAAERKLYAILPSEAPGTLEYDVWRSIHALEGTLKLERGKTVMLSRTRQKIGKVGEVETVRALVNSLKPSEGFAMLVERDMIDHSFEAVALRHPDRFDPETLAAATARLGALS